jgi:hypothetical protein
MMRHWKKAVFTATCAAFLSACMDAPPQKEAPLMSFDQYKPIMLNVAKIEIIDKFKAEGDGKHVELLMKQPPESAVQELLKKQLVAAGPSGLLRVIIDDASVVGEKLPVTEGMKGMFTNEPAERYRARIALRFESASDEAPDITKAHAEVSADRTKTVMKDASPAERDMAFYKLDEELMDDVSHGLQTVVRSTFGLN